jgi:hypothetical protein
MISVNTTILHPVALQVGWACCDSIEPDSAGQLDGGHILRLMIGEKANYL